MPLVPCPLPAISPLRQHRDEHQASEELGEHWRGKTLSTSTPATHALSVIWTRLSGPVQEAPFSTAWQAATSLCPDWLICKQEREEKEKKTTTVTVSKDISNPKGHNQGAARSSCMRHIGSFIPAHHQAASGVSPHLLSRKKKRTEEERVAAGSAKNPTSIISLDSLNCVLRHVWWSPFYEIWGSGKLSSTESHTTCKQPSWNLDLDQSEFMSFQGLVLLGLVCSRCSISVLSLVHSRCSKSMLSKWVGGVRADKAEERDVNRWFLVVPGISWCRVEAVVLIMRKRILWSWGRWGRVRQPSCHHRQGTGFWNSGHGWKRRLFSSTPFLHAHQARQSCSCVWLSSESGGDALSPPPLPSPFTQIQPSAYEKGGSTFYYLRIQTRGKWIKHQAQTISYLFSQPSFIQARCPQQWSPRNTESSQRADSSGEKVENNKYQSTTWLMPSEQGSGEKLRGNCCCSHHCHHLISQGGVTQE